MAPIAIIFMVLSLLTVWGGMVTSMIFLARRPQVTGGWADHPDMDRDDDQVE